MSNKILQEKLDTLLNYNLFYVQDRPAYLSEYLSHITNSLGFYSGLFSFFTSYCLQNYGGMEYNLIPLTILEGISPAITERNYMENIAKTLARPFIRNRQVLLQFDNTIASLEGLNQYKEIDYSHKQTGTISEEIIKDETDVGKSMGENSPISSGTTVNGETNYTIDTPSSRSNSNFNHTADNSNTQTFNKTDTDKNKETNPYYYEKYMQVVEKYRIFDIFNEAIQQVIQEYNEVF